jgi:hypothetical protein
LLGVCKGIIPTARSEENVKERNRTSREPEIKYAAIETNTIIAKEKLLLLDQRKYLIKIIIEKVISINRRPNGPKNTPSNTNIA